jgi:rod shape determining protein RodA
VYRNSSYIYWPLLTLVLFLSMISIINLYGTTGPHVANIYINQTYWLGLGFICMFVVLRLDDHFIRRWIPAFYISVMVLLVLVLLIGKKVNGSQRWIDLKFFTFQPSELAKIAVILMLAHWFQKNARPEGYTIIDLIPVLLILACPMFLIFREPDLGHTLIIALIALSMFACERFTRKTVVGSVLTLICSFPFLWIFVLKKYQKERILTLIDSRVDRLGAGWHSYQAEIAVGSGGLIGKGHLKGTQVAGGFLPENHTDFVFAKLSEEHGLLGASLVLTIYLGIILCALYTAYTGKNRFASHLAVGVGAFIFWQVIMNVGMVLNLLPVTGVTLPLLSYGGTSIITVMIALGLLLNTHARRHIF